MTGIVRHPPDRHNPYNTVETLVACAKQGTHIRCGAQLAEGWPGGVPGRREAACLRAR
jgi:hypothetical protein